MTDKQFNSYIRMLLLQLRDIYERLPRGEAKDNLQSVIDNLQIILEEPNRIDAE